MNYLFKTPGGTLYHSGDSYYSYWRKNMVMSIDRGLGSLRRKTHAYYRQMTSADILRMGEALNAKVVIQFPPRYLVKLPGRSAEIRVLWEMKKDRLKYGFAAYLQVGGNYRPLDKDNFEYHYPRGFDDCLTIEPDLPFAVPCNLSLAPIAEMLAPSGIFPGYLGKYLKKSNFIGIAHD